MTTNAKKKKIVLKGLKKYRVERARIVMGAVTAIVLFLIAASCEAQTGGHEIVITPNANDVTFSKEMNSEKFVEFWGK